MKNNSAIEYSPDGVVSAPSNIALIKYMGHNNKNPINPSLSYTLPKIRTRISLEKTDVDNIIAPVGKDRFMQYYLYLKKHFVITDNFTVKSTNNFPANCGLASSASSFAALTAAMANLVNYNDLQSVAYLSRLGSGSSCRSFFKNFVTWSESCVFQEDLPLMNLHHSVIMVDTQPKKISSSQAHTLVQTSALFEKRKISAKERFHNLKSCIKQKKWQAASELIQAEYLEMHDLFESANPAFSYRNSLCRKIEQWLDTYKTLYGYSPWVTLDAGPNIHLLFNEITQKNHLILELRKSFPKIEILNAC